MKVALCFSGLPRNIKDTYKSIYENLLVPNNIEDVFFHTWECEDKQNIGNQYEDYIYDKSDQEFMFEKYQPKRYIEEPQGSYKNDPNNLSDDVLSKYERPDITKCSDKQSQFYSQYQAVKLITDYQKDNGFVYDAVIKMRFDLIFFNPIIVKNLDLQIVYILNFMTNMETELMINDWMAVGSYDNIQKYAEVWINLKLLLDQGVRIFPEELMAKNLINYGIEVNPVFRNNKDFSMFNRDYA